MTVRYNGGMLLAAFIAIVFGIVWNWLLDESDRTLAMGCGPPLVVFWVAFMFTVVTTPTQLYIFNDTGADPVVVSVAGKKHSVPRGGWLRVELEGTDREEVLATDAQGRVLEKVWLDPDTAAKQVYNVKGRSTVLLVDYTELYDQKKSYEILYRFPAGVESSEEFGDVGPDSPMPHPMLVGEDPISEEGEWRMTKLERLPPDLSDWEIRQHLSRKISEKYLPEIRAYNGG